MGARQLQAQGLEVGMGIIKASLQEVERLMHPLRPETEQTESNLLLSGLELRRMEVLRLLLEVLEYLQREDKQEEGTLMVSCLLAEAAGMVQYLLVVAQRTGIVRKGLTLVLPCRV